jgi:hypothetical protein
MAAGRYTVVGEAQTIATAITIIEVAAPSTAVLKLIRAWVTQSSVTTSAAFRVQLLRKTATITGTASPPTPRPTIPGYAASGATVKWVATAEGTDGVVLDGGGGNHLNGYQWVPTDQNSHFYVPPSGIIALKFPAAPTSASWTFGMEWDEFGS